jgi:hypothetical protein
MARYRVSCACIVMGERSYFLHLSLASKTQDTEIVYYTVGLRLYPTGSEVSILDTNHINVYSFSHKASIILV